MQLPRSLLCAAAALAISALPVLTAAADNAATFNLKVSDNHRFLVRGDGQPFFYLGDTAWELFHRLNREEADRYLSDRASKGFTVVQAVAWAELDGLKTPNAYGHLPIRDDDPTKPWIEDGPNNDYWDHVDYIVNRANELGITIALLPSWGDKWNKSTWGKGPEVFTPDNAGHYGEWLGKRYRSAGVIWMMGGDRPIENDTQRAIITRMAKGLRRGDGGSHLITFHPPGMNGSSTWWHDADWLDYNSRQNGHTPEYFSYDKTLVDYRRTPVKPVIDAEPLYEDHPIAFDQSKLGHSVAADVRRPLYWDLFNGACGHTYGHHSVWQMYSKDKEPVNDPLMPWSEAIGEPGAGQMQYARWLLESRPYLTRIPDPDLIVTERPKTSWPGEGRYRFVGTRDQSGSYALIYAPVGRRFTVKTSLLSGSKLKAWWYNPRDGKAQPAGEFEKKDTQEFVPPNPGELTDWVLVLDDAARGFPAPGTRR